VLLSTVRSRHLIDKLIVDCCDFGFLSEQKLLNTAMTRAKSWLGVVGDPVALCSVGDCSRIWRTYLKQCGDINSILPPEMNLKEIWRLTESLSRDESAMLGTNAGSNKSLMFPCLQEKFDFIMEAANLFRIWYMSDTQGRNCCII